LYSAVWVDYGDVVSLGERHIQNCPVIAIRFLQGAKNRMLIINSILAATTLALAVGFYRLTPKDAVSRAIIPALSSLAAVAGIAVQSAWYQHEDECAEHAD